MRTLFRESQRTSMVFVWADQRRAAHVTAAMSMPGLPHHWCLGYLSSVKHSSSRVVVVDLSFTTLLTSQVICVAFYSEREKSDKFCSETFRLEVLLRAVNLRHVTHGFTFLPKEVILRIFKLWKNPSTPTGFEPFGWGSFTCRISTTRDPRLYFPSEGSHTRGFLLSEEIHRLRPGLNLSAEFILRDVELRHGTHGFTSLPKEVILRIFKL